LEFERKIEVLTAFRTALVLPSDRAYLDNGVYTEWDAACKHQLRSGSEKKKDLHIDHKISIVPGRPSVFFLR
jgi:hypothetical protein